MPATSERQRKIFAIALSMREGDTPFSYSEEAAKIARDTSISTEDLRKFARGPIKKGD